MQEMFVSVLFSLPRTPDDAVLKYASYRIYPVEFFDFEDISLVEGKEILPVERITALCETNGVDIADLKNETKFSRREDSVPAQQYGSWRSHEP